MQFKFFMREIVVTFCCKLHQNSFGGFCFDAMQTHKSTVLYKCKISAMKICNL